MDDSRLQTFASRDLLTPIDDWLSVYTPGLARGVLPVPDRSLQLPGQAVRLPLRLAPGGWYVNKKMWDEAGLGDLPTEDWNWDQILEAAKAMTKDVDGDGVMDQWGLGDIPTDSSGGAYWIVKSFGGDYWNETVTESKIDLPETAQAFQFIADLIWDSKVMPSAALVQGLGMDMEYAFASGQIGLHYALNDTSFIIGEAIGDKFEWTVARPRPARQGAISSPAAPPSPFPRRRNSRTWPMS